MESLVSLMWIYGEKVVLLCFQSWQINNVVDAAQKTEHIVIDNANINEWENIK